MINNRLNNVIISNNSFVFDLLKDNISGTKFQLLGAQNELDSFLKDNLVVNILIIDALLDNLAAVIRSKNSINLTDMQIAASIKLERPFLISTLIKNIFSYDQDDSIFCSLNDSLIYNQKISQVIDVDNQKTISLTAKENQIIIQLLCAKNSTLMKCELIAKIWPNSSIEQSTLEFHLLNLRQKLSIIETSDQHVNLL
jgi:DNA-binding response OmpR family regulator